MNNETNTEKSKLFNFSFEVADSTLSTFTHLKLFNGYNEIVSQGYGNMNLQVPKGIYQLRVEMNEHVEDRNYRVTEDIADRLETINTASATPLVGITSTHEYFSGPSMEWSRKSTETGQFVSGNSIFIFLRYSDKNIPFENIKAPEKGFVILNEYRQVVFSLKKSNVKSESGEHSEFYGSIAFHEKVPPGQYYLQYKTKELSWEIPLYVFENWQTQLFMMIRETPSFSTARISIEKQGFSSQSPENLQLDAMIQKMYNGIYILPESLREAAAIGKWQNPMLGIISCYMYLMSNDSKDDRLFDTILSNLENFILNDKDAPDLAALRLLAAVHFNKPLPKQSLSAPCMVSAGMSIFLKQSSQDEGLIKKGSVAEKVFRTMHAESIWTTYDPSSVKRSSRPEKKTSKQSQLDAYVHIDIGKQESSIQFNPGKDWITATIFDQLSSIKTEPVIAEIATQLQITNNTVRLALNKMKKVGNLNAVANSIFGDNISPDEMESQLKSIQGKIDTLLK